jgi:hypothetical protein
MDVVQVVLIISIVALTAVFIIIGIWLVLLLREIRKVIRRVNDTAEEINSFAAKINEPGAVFSGIVEGLKNGAEIIALIRSFTDRNEKRSRK